ncbi:uncharacterized protein JCM15063_000190 [Sporobolomyces koalae]|uniref:uncharacterized protein n=1 Tax=Sporobolomyces koalae TaxID=500713 RepID=UPI0031808669
MVAWRSLLGLGALVASSSRQVRAYIPALPTNDTSTLARSDDLLHLAYYNGPFSVFTADVARQLLAEGFGDDGNYTNTTTIIPWTRYSKGVLLHFDETLRAQPPAAVPWLAMINCDTNGTSYSDVDDIFTICRDLGAQAAVLYSLTAQGCMINSEYLNDYEKVLDVYATTSLQNARIIESQFGNVNSSAWQYNSEALNSSATLIEALLANNALSVVGNIPVNISSTEEADASMPSATSTSDTQTDSSTDSSVIPTATSSTTGMRRAVKRQAATTTAPNAETSRAAAASTSNRPSRTSTTRAVPSPTVAINYLGAVVAARNLTVGGLNSSAAPTSNQNNNKNDGPSTGLAMIILYSITGVVTFLFFVVILCGAIRAIRHPERYGPRTGFGYGNYRNAPGGGSRGERGAGAGPQNRAQGLARAVLDTFPIVRFGGGGGAYDARPDEEGAGRDGDSHKELKDGQDEALELTQLAPVLSATSPSTATPYTRRSDDDEEEIASSTSRDDRHVRRSMSTHSFHSAVSVPSQSIGASNDLSIGHLAVVGVPPAPSDAHVQSKPTTSLVPVPVTSPTTTGPTPASDDTQSSCPICVCDFETGDSIRILPCDGRHQFHVECIDPWLLGVSRLCPLCRLDLGQDRIEPSGALSTTTTREGPTATRGEEVDAGTEDREARERERERHEEERVVRHLRGLLNRNSPSGPTATTTTTSATTPPAASSIADRIRRTRSNSQHLLTTMDSSETARGSNHGDTLAETNGLRSRFAKYVAGRRRARNGSNASHPTIS